MHIEVNPELPDDMAEVLDAGGRLIARFAPALEDTPPGTAALRVSSAAFDRLLGELEAGSRCSSENAGYRKSASLNGR